MTDRTCEVQGCSNPHDAKGMCLLHYNRHRRKRPTVTCAHCGVEFQTTYGKRQDRYYCTHACYAESVRKPRSSPIRIVDCANCGTAFTAHGSGRGNVRYCSRPCQYRKVWTAECEQCGSEMHVVTRPPKYCSAECRRSSDPHRLSQRRTKAARRARKRSAQHVNYDPMDIFERDGWRCQLCRRKVRRDVSDRHDLAPSIDHIIPLGPDGPDTPDNVQTAHRICNARKGATGPGQLRLVG